MLGPAFDQSRDVVVGERLFQPGLQPVGFGIQPSADERLHLVAQLLADSALGHACRLDALDDVTSVDVGLAVAGVRDDEDDPNFTVGIADGSNGRDESRLFVLDAGGQEPKVLAYERCAAECGDVRLEAGTELPEVEPRDLCRADCRSFGRLGHLSGDRQ